MTCCRKCLDRIFLGHLVRPLFSGDNNATAIRDGLTNTVVTAGVVGALVFSMTLEAAMQSEPDGKSYATTASFCWYASSGNACWSVLTSTLAAVALAITPEHRINVIGLKLLWCWVIPFEATMMSLMFMGLGMWADAERAREAFLESNFNMTGTDAFLAFQHGGIVIWSVRFFMVFTGLVGAILTLFVMCCGRKLERATGLATTTAIGEHHAADATEQKARRAKISPVD